MEYYLGVLRDYPAGQLVSLVVLHLQDRHPHRVLQISILKSGVHSVLFNKTWNSSHDQYRKISPKKSKNFFASYFLFITHIPLFVPFFSIPLIFSFNIQSKLCHLIRIKVCLRYAKNKAHNIKLWKLYLFLLLTGTIGLPCKMIFSY